MNPDADRYFNEPLRGRTMYYSPIGDGRASAMADEGAMAEAKDENPLSAPEQLSSKSYSNFNENSSSSFVEIDQSYLETESTSNTTEYCIWTPPSPSMASHITCWSNLHPSNARLEDTSDSQYFTGYSSSEPDPTQNRGHQDNVLHSHHPQQNELGDNIGSQMTRDNVFPEQHFQSTHSGDDLQPSAFGNTGLNHSELIGGTDVRLELIDPQLEWAQQRVEAALNIPIQTYSDEPWSTFHPSLLNPPHQTDPIRAPTGHEHEQSHPAPQSSHPQPHRNQWAESNSWNATPLRRMSDIEHATNIPRGPGPGSASSKTSQNKDRKPCTQCGKLLRPSSLAKHKLTHGPKKFVCPECAKGFSTNKDCGRHVNAVHVRERKHICPRCGRRFNRAENLRRHERSQHSRADAPVDEES